jgi:hypothetical protein
MLTVCPNCATSSGVEIAILQSFSGWMRQARCRYCQLVWQAELSSADKLLFVADALALAQEAIAATPKVAVNAPNASLQFSGSSTLQLDEFEPGKGVWAPARLPATMQVEQSADADVAAERLYDPAAVIARCSSWCTSWRLPRSYLQLVILGLAIADTALIGWRADLVRAMPQTASWLTSERSRPPVSQRRRHGGMARRHARPRREGRDQQHYRQSGGSAALAFACSKLRAPASLFVGHTAGPASLGAWRDDAISERGCFAAAGHTRDHGALRRS